MAAARHFGVAERRRRLIERHFLASPGPNIESVAGAMVGLHATDPATFALSLWARLRGFRVSDLDDALYERHSVLRMLGMRRTMFVVPRDLAAVIDAACTRDLVAPERRKLVRMLEDAGITTDGEAWIDDAYRTVLATLACHPALSARELGEKLEVLRTQVTAGAGSKWAVDVGVASRILFLLATEGYIVRDRPTGGWLSSQHRWSPLDRHFAPWPVLPRAEARAALLTRWLRTFGPGTLTDITWWAKWTKADVRAALAAVGAAEVTADDGGGRAVPAYVLADDLDAPEDDDDRGQGGVARRGVVAAGARLLDHGVEAARLVRRSRPRRPALRQQRQRRPGRDVRWPGDRRVGPAGRRHRGDEPARTGVPDGGQTDRRESRRAVGLARRHTGRPTVPDPAPAPAGCRGLTAHPAVRTVSLSGDPTRPGRDMGTKLRVGLAVVVIGVFVLAWGGASTQAVVRVGAIVFAVGSLVIFFSAGGRRHAQPPVPVPTDPWPSVSGRSTPEVDLPDTDQ